MSAPAFCPRRSAWDASVTRSGASFRRAASADQLSFGRIWKPDSLELLPNGFAQSRLVFLFVRSVKGWQGETRTLTRPWLWNPRTIPGARQG